MEKTEDEPPHVQFVGASAKIEGIDTNIKERENHLQKKHKQQDYGVKQTFEGFF